MRDSVRNALKSRWSFGVVILHPTEFFEDAKALAWCEGIRALSDDRDEIVRRAQPQFATSRCGAKLLFIGESSAMEGLVSTAVLRATSRSSHNAG